jgi:resuscitation-promoting factor RpfA
MHQRSTARARGRAAAIMAASLVAAAVAWRLRPAPPSAQLPADTDIARTCAWLAWLLGGYVSLAVTAAAGGELFAGVGRAKACLHRVVPRPLRAIVETIVSLGIVASVLSSVTGPASASAAPAGAVSMPHPAALARAASLTAIGDPLDWPGLRDPAPATPAKPATPVSTGTPAPASHRRQPPVGLVGGGHGGDPRTAAATPTAGGEVVVGPGDTLWSIAAAHLPPAASDASIDQLWHEWYAANRQLIGPDPSLLHPGQRLVPPPHLSSRTAAPAHS